MSDVIKLLNQCIEQRLYLKRKYRKWRLSDNDVTIEFKVPNRKSLGFSLDQKNINDVFGFFAGSPPKGIAKMCDGIIALNYKEETYIFLLEQKSNNLSEYKKQLINGWHFCQWLFSLLKEHKYYTDSVKYIGLVYSSRLRPNKETSTHQEPKPKLEKYGLRFKTDKKINHLLRYI